MGGHGGLNILPQKRWNVYNYDNREKVKRDEEAAAKEEQLKRDQSRRRDAELRLNELRQARGLSVPDSGPKPSTSSAPVQTELPKSDSDSKHMNLLEGIRIFDPVEVDKRKIDEKKGKFDRIKRVKKEEEIRVVGPEDEKYRLGYGVAGKGVKLPWYMEKRERSGDGDRDGERDDERRKSGGGGEKKRKTIEELREERIKRERGEKERERALLMVKSRKDRGFSLRR